MYPMCWQRWFGGGAAQDKEIKDKFGADVERMRAGDLAHWRSQPFECLAGVSSYYFVCYVMFEGIYGGNDGTGVSGVAYGDHCDPVLQAWSAEHHLPPGPCDS